MPIIKDHIVKNFPFGTISRIEERPLPKGAASDSLNWLTSGDRIELRRGSDILGDEVTGSGAITGLVVATRFDGTQVPFWSRGRKIEYYNSATELRVESATANILPAAADGEDIAFSTYHSLAGAMLYASSRNSSIYKVPIANPTNWKDLSSTSHRGKIKIKNNACWLWDRGDSNGGRDQTGLYRSYVDKDELSDYTQVTGEALGGSGSITYSGTLAAISAVRTVHFIVISATVAAGTETFQDDRNGVLSSNFGGTGTINYATGAYSVTFSAVTTGSVTASYYHETSTSTGVADFSKSATRTAGQGFALRQDDGGADMQNLGSVGGDEYCLHIHKSWKTTISADDASATNIIYRARVGIPYWRAMAETGDGVYYVDNTDSNNPFLRLLTYDPAGNDQIIPISVSDNIDLSDYRFDAAVVREWGTYILLGCRHKDSTYNNTLFVYNKLWKAWDRMGYRVTTLEEYNGTLIAGDSISNNVFTLFADWTDEEANIENYWISGDDLLGAEGTKVANIFVIAGLIVPDQSFDIYLSLDNGAWTLVGTIDGDASYVDVGTHIGIGTSVMGSNEIGGGGTGNEASPYRREFRINTDRFEYVKLKFEATGVGYVSVNEYQFKDIRARGRRVASQYVVN